MTKFFGKDQSGFYNNFIELSPGLYTPLISKNACSTLFYSLIWSKNDIKYKNLQQYDTLSGLWYKRQKYIINDISILESQNCFAVIRDPLDRIASAYKTLSYTELGMTIDIYVNNVLDAFKLAEDSKYIDRHIASQFIQYNSELINEYVKIEDLSTFLCSKNIEYMTINKSKHQIDLSNYKPELLPYLESDYEIYNNIINSKQLYKPGDK